LLVVGVLAVNAASIWEIAMTLRLLRDRGERSLEQATSARARSLESRLSVVDVDLAFLAGSLSRGLRPGDGRAERSQIGARLLLLLRGHPEVGDLLVRRADGVPLLAAGRPRGIPGFWTPGPDASSTELPAGATRRAFEIPGADEGATSARLEATLDAHALLDDERSDESLASVTCRLSDATGELLAREEGAEARPGSHVAEAPVRVGGWDEDGPWTLGCRSAVQPPTAQLEPVVVRHRTMILLNLAVMVVAAGLGVFAYQQALRRRELEDRAEAERRVRELERQLFHAERLGTVGRLAAGMAHEINNPLEGISNYLRLGREALRKGDAEATGRYLEGIGQGLEQAAGIVCRVLDHANPSGPPQEIVDVSEVVGRSVEFVRTRDEFAAVRFETDFPAEPCRARASSVMLGQVFLNLVLNACEAQPDGGEVRVRCRRDGRHVEVDVADRGPGVPPARRGRIFEPFETTKRSAGLGLSICHSIVQQHGGELTVHDREGGGSIFRVRLKVVDGSSAEPSEEPSDVEA
jgi:signal transduction histidine kinase